jgi:hypothetical protein
MIAGQKSIGFKDAKAKEAAEGLRNKEEEAKSLTCYPTAQSFNSNRQVSAKSK